MTRALTNTNKADVKTENALILCDATTEVWANEAYPVSTVDLSTFSTVFPRPIKTWKLCRRRMDIELFCQLNYCLRISTWRFFEFVKTTLICQRRINVEIWKSVEKNLIVFQHSFIIVKLTKLWNGPVELAITTQLIILHLSIGVELGYKETDTNSGHSVSVYNRQFKTSFT